MKNILGFLKSSKRNYNGKQTENDAICCHCGKQFMWDEDNCEVYRGKFLCADCFSDWYGYCNECGKLNKYCDMNEDIVCKGCQ